MFKSFQKASLLQIRQFKLVFQFSNLIQKPDIRALNPEYLMINYYREQGHHFAKLDPLNIQNKYHPYLIESTSSFASPQDFNLNSSNNVSNLYELDEFDHFRNQNVKTVQDLQKIMEKIYLNKAGVEFSHITNRDEKDWLYKNFEDIMLLELSKAEKMNIHQSLVQTEALDHYLHKKFNNFKRYSGEGSESMIIFLKNLFSQASQNSVKEIVLGMPHRGRMNFLLNLLDFPPRDLFRKIQGFLDVPKELYTAVDDVVHHLSTSNKKVFNTGSGNPQSINISMVHNPSHLEAVNPVTMGKTKAKQDDYNDYASVLNVQLHGDAAITGQGVVYETFAISKVPKYQIDGSIHLIVNNQIGYTTDSKDQRPTKYSTEICKAFEVPIIHVNADCPETVHKIANLCIQYRKKFKKDIMIDLIGYRRYGHNELDEPEFTQPLMYQQIRKNQKTCPQLYDQQLRDLKIVKENEFEKIREKVFAYFDLEFQESKNIERTIEKQTNENNKGSRTLTGKWKNMKFAQYTDESPTTGLNVDYLINLGRESTKFPTDFNIHPRVLKYHIQERNKSLDNKIADWATAEAMASMSLVDEGYNFRLSGEDVERGTFSQRHWVLTDQINGQQYDIIKNWAQNKGRFQVLNSPLSELGVVAYDYGYSLENPNNLVIWEAQFGDFFNPAQPMYDTFVTCGEEKWLRQSSMVSLLPHGFDGAGPEHSSCRIERFLQNGATQGIGGFEPATYKEVNFYLANPSTSANYFHILRRQMKRQFRKPLIIASPKTLLKSKDSQSPLSDFAEGTQFHPVLKYDSGNKYVFLSSGKFSYDIRKILPHNQNIQGQYQVLVLEELLPFPQQEILKNLQSIDKDAKFIWAQEEPMNAGAFTYIKPHFQRILKNMNFSNQEIHYIGRKAIASCAVGSSQINKLEYEQLQQQLIDFN